jgi:hypothetical protein
MARTLLACILILALVTSCSDDRIPNEPQNNESLAVSILTPPDSSTVSERLTVTVLVQGGQVDAVELHDLSVGRQIAVDSTLPYSFNIDITAVSDGSTLTLEARAILPDGGTLSSEPVLITVDNSSSRPLPVQLVVSEHVTDSTVTLIWNRSDAADFSEYRLYVDSLPAVDQSDSQLAAISSRYDTSFVAYHGLENTIRYYRVYVYDSTRLYSASNEVAATTENLPPATPSLTVVEDSENRAIEMFWSKSEVHDFERYELYLIHASGGDLTINIVLTAHNHTDTTYLYPNPQLLFKHRFYLRVYDTEGDSATSETVVAQIPSGNDLQAHYDFEQLEGLTIRDLSGNENHAGRRNGAGTTADGFGNCLELDGMNDRATFPPLYQNSPAAITVSVWAAADCDGCGCMVYHGENGEWALCADPDDALECRIRLETGEWRTYRAEIKADSTWHHYAMVWVQGVGVAAYLNGDSLGMMPLPDRALFDPHHEYVPTLGSFGCGCSIDDHFRGRLDEVRIYTRALTTAEIRILSEQ